MKLDEYVKKNGHSLPRLSSVYTKYSNVFKKHYKWVSGNLVFLKNRRNKTGFYCFKDESKKYKQNISMKKYSYKDFKNVATIRNIRKFEKKYSEGFKDGFNDVEFKPRLTNSIIDNIVLEDYIKETFGRIGILINDGFSDKFKRYLLPNEESSYRNGYNEGKRFKSYFLYVEHYEQFKGFPEPFMRQMKYYVTKTKYQTMHFNYDKVLDSHNLNYVDVSDNRIETKQTKEEVSEFFSTKLREWYCDEDIEHFLKANFKYFKDKKSPKVICSTKENTWGLQKRLYGWTHDFYTKENYKGEKKIRFAEMLKNNFDVMQNSTLDTINKAIRKK